MRSKHVIMAAVLGLAALSATPSARAADAIWQGNFTRYWTTGFNWLNFAPGPGDRAYFTNNNPLVANTAVILDSNRLIGGFQVDGNSLLGFPYSFSQENNAVLLVNGLARIGFLGAPVSTTAFDGFLMDASFLTVAGGARVELVNNAIVRSANVAELYEDGRLYLTSGELEADGGINLFNNSQLIVGSSGTLNMASGTSLNLDGSNTRVTFLDGFGFGSVTVNASPGADVFGDSYVDIGNGEVTTVNINGVGASLTASGTTVSDWGLGAGGSATVNLTNGSVANVQKLNIGNGSGSASVSVRSGATLNVNGLLTMGGGASVRTVALNVDGGTLNLGNANFNDKADVNVIAGTARFQADAQFNAGSRLDWTGGSIDSTNVFLTFSGATFNRTTKNDELSNGSALRILAGGQSPGTGYYDIANNNASGSLLVSGAGSTFNAGGTSDWGRNAGHTANVSIDNNAIATLSSLRIGTSNGAANVFVSTGGQLKPSTLEVGGGSTARTVNLTINGGTVSVTDANSSTTFNDKAVLTLQAGTFDPKGNVTFFAGSTANWSGGTFLVGSGKTLTVSGGIINRTNAAAGGLSPGATLVINSAGRFESVGSYSVGEFGAGTATVTGAGSRFNVAGNFTLGQSSGGSAGNLTIGADGRINVGDTATSNNVSTFSFIEDAGPGANDGGTLSVFAGSTLTNTVNSGLSIGRGVGRRGSVLVSGAGATINDNATFLGFQGNGTLTVNAGGKYIANSADFATSGGTATVTIDGVGSQLWSKGNLNLGSATNGGAGTITTNNGGRLFVGDAAGEAGFGVAVADSRPIGTAGVLTIANGSTLTSADGALIGAFSSPGSPKNGRVVVTGTNSLWNAGANINTGFNGTGELNIQSGGRVVTTGNAFAGSFGGTGTINVSSGGRLETTFQVVLCQDAGTTGTATVNGADSTIAVGTILEVGRSAPATLNIQAGGRVMSSSAIAGSNAGGVGTITVDGANSSLRASSNLTIDRGSTITTTNGGNVLVGDNATGFATDRLNIADNNPIGTNQGGKLTITNGSTLNHHSRVLVAGLAGTFGEVDISGANSKFLVGERLIVGNNGVGRTTVASGGLLKVDSYGITSANGSKIFLNTGGTMEANASFSNMMTETRGYLATGFNGGNWLGNGLTTTAVASDSRLAIGYQAVGSLLTIKLALKGDTDLTGAVDFDDLLVLAQNYNLTNKFWQNGDFNYDGNVNFDDLLSLAQNYNQSLSVSQTTDLGSDVASDWALARSMVPEPMAAGLLMLAAPMIARRRGTR